MVLSLACALLITATPKLHLAIDVPVTLAAGAGWLVLDRAAPMLARTGCPCARSDVPSFDRFAIDAGFSQGGLLANTTLGTGLAGDALVLALDASSPREAAEEIGLVAEAVAIVGLGTEIAKIAFSRPYPYMLRGDAAADQLRGGINYAAMWSGHTAVLMAAGVATARILDLRDAPLGLRIAMWIAAPVLALTAGALEISQGNHYPSDVLVGAAAGALVGWGVVALHATRF